MALSDQLEDLASRTKKLEDTAAAVRAKNVVKLEQQREQFHSAMETQAERVRSKAAETKAGAQQWWAGIATDMERRRAQLESKRQEFKAQRAAENAEWQAEDAEDYASTIATVAAYFVDEAAYSAVDATVLREKADAMKKDTVTTGS